MIISVPVLVNAQQEKGTIVLEPGFGVGGYATEFVVAGTPTETDGAAPGSMYVGANYAFGGVYALGLRVSAGSYLQSEEDQAAGEPTVAYSQVALVNRFTIVNGHEFQFFTDVNLTSTTTGDETSTGALRGPGVEVMPGINYYFGEKAGIAFQIGYGSYTHEGSVFGIIDYEWNFSGVQTRLGATIRF